MGKNKHQKEVEEKLKGEEETLLICRSCISIDF